MDQWQSKLTTKVIIWDRKCGKKPNTKNFSIFSRKSIELAIVLENLLKFGEGSS